MKAEISIVFRQTDTGAGGPDAQVADAKLRVDAPHIMSGRENRFIHRNSQDILNSCLLDKTDYTKFVSVAAMKNLLSIISLIALTIFLTGCPPRPAEPDPSMTAVGAGSGARGAGAGAGDWLNPADLDGAGMSGGDLGLLARGSADGFADGNQIRDLLPSVFFDFDQFAIRPGDRAALQSAAAHMAANPEDRLLIEGHCDWRGTTEYNMVLGERRASSVRQFLINLGVDAHRMETVSFGDLKATKEGTEAQMARDRRADLVIVR